MGTADRHQPERTPRRLRQSRCLGLERPFFVATIDAQLVALDALARMPGTGFVSPDLTKGLRRAPDYRGEYEQTSPPAVFGNMVITGSAIADNNHGGASCRPVRPPRTTMTATR